MEKQTTAVASRCLCSVRGGGQLFFNHAHAADVTGGDVYIDNTPAHPIPAVTPPAGGAIRSSSDNGDVHHNRLILDGVVYGANIYGGFTAGSGNADHNTLVFRNGAVTTATPYVIPAGGFSTAGNARYNTVIINGTGAAGSGMSVLGGYGGDGTKDLWTGNTLVVQRSGNQLRGVGFFQKVQFDLDNSIANGDTMLTIHVVWGNPVDWDKSSVTGVSDWIAHMRSQGINTPSLTLYTGAGVQLRNYAPTLMMNITDYEYGWRSNAAGTGTVIATGMTLDSSQFKGVTTPSVVSGITRGGYSVYGNTTQTNKVDINAGSHADVRAGYTNGLNGGSEHNTLNLTGGNVTNGYAGYTTGVHLLADPTSPTNPAAVDTLRRTRHSYRRTTFRRAMPQATSSTSKAEYSAAVMKSMAAIRTARARRRGIPSTSARVTVRLTRPRSRMLHSMAVDRAAPPVML